MSQITVNKIQGLTTGGNANTIVLNTNSTDVLTINSSGNVNIANSLTIGHDETISLGNNGVIGSPDDPYFATSEGGSGHGFKINGALAAIYPSTATGSGQNDTTDLGYSTAKWRNLYLSGGVYLGGTGSTNLLDDYEEGTFTPAFVGSSSSDFTYLVRGGAYTKIGSLVNINLYIRLSSKGTSSGGIYLTDFPFAVADTVSNTAIEASGIVGYTSGFATTMYGPLTALAHTNSGGGNGAEIYFNNAGSGHSTLLSDSHISDTFNIRVSVTYRTN